MRCADAAGTEAMGDEPEVQPEVAQEGDPPPRRALRELWLAPTLALGLVLLVTGLVTAKRSAPGPDFIGALDDVAALLKRESYESALEKLNDEIRPRLDHELATGPVWARFHAYRGDALYFAQLGERIDDPRNHEAIEQEFALADERGVVYEPEREGRWARTLAALGRIEEAIEHARSLPKESEKLRLTLYREIVDKLIEQRGGPRGYEVALNLLTEISSGANQSREDILWGVSRQARLRLDAGYAEDALGQLLRDLQRVGPVEGEAFARLYLLLSEAYFDLGKFDESARQVERALTQIPENSPVRGDALTTLARALQGGGLTQEAKDIFAQVVMEFPDGELIALARFGLASSEASLSNHDESAKRFEEVLAAFREDPDRTRLLDTDEVAGTLLDISREREAQDDTRRAADFAKMAQRLYPPGEGPTDAFIVIARSKRSLGEQTLAEAGVSGEDPVRVAAMDPVTRAEARAFFAEAAGNYLAYARRMVLVNDDVFADALFLSADSFDLAGEQDRAIEVFGEFIRARPDDARNPEAVFRLAQAHDAMGDGGVAADMYQEVMTEHPNAPEGTRSIVALARLWLNDQETDNDAEGEALLRRVLNGGLLAPEALEYRTALFELGKALNRQERYPQAIARFNEAVSRYEGDPREPEIRFMLADALRLNAEEIGETLETALPESTRAELTAQRGDRLREARRNYELVREAYESRDPRRLTGLEETWLRHALLYRADTTYDLGEYEEAIRLYDAAAQRFATEPLSLVAMAQIVNAYVAMGDLSSARTAQERARNRLREMTPEAWERSREIAGVAFWERWLDSELRLEAQSTTADAGNG